MGFRERDTTALPAKPNRLQVYSEYRDDLATTTHSVGLTPAKLARLMRAAESGDMHGQMSLFDELLRKNAHLGSVYRTRRLAVTGTDWELSAANASARAKDIAAFCRDAIDACDNWHDALGDLMDAVGKAYAVGQLCWELVGGSDIVTHIEQWPQREFTFETEAADEPRVITEREPSKGETLAPGQWIVHRSKARSGTLAGGALFTEVSWPVLFGAFNIKDWLAFLEAFGHPRRIAKYPRGIDANGPEAAAIWKALEDLGADGRAMVPEGVSLELIFAKAGSDPGYLSLVKWCEAQISKAVLGQTLTTDEGQHGTRAQAQVHDGVRGDLLRSDCRALAATLRAQYLTPLTVFKYGPEAARDVPRFEFLLEDDEDLKARAEVDRILVRDIGLPLEKEYFYATYDRPRPENDKDLVEPPAPAPAMGAAMRLLPAGDEGDRLVGAEKKSPAIHLERWGAWAM